MPRRGRVNVSRTLRNCDSLTATGCRSRKRHEKRNSHVAYQPAMTSQGVRRAGAAASDLAYDGGGRLDFFWEFALKPWDMAAGCLLVREAGGVLTTVTGEPCPVAETSILAGNPQMHAWLLDTLRQS